MDTTEPTNGAQERILGSGNWFAVVDGARFANLPPQLKSARLPCRSLFLDTMDEDVRCAGPWLVRLSECTAVARLHAATGDLAKCVFWRCTAGELPLFKHLRKLNLVELPDGDRVMFRHYDPGVLIVLARNLEAHQESAFFGPSEEVSVYSQRFARQTRAPEAAART